MKRILLLAVSVVFLTSCERTDCYVCERDYYDPTGAVTKTEMLETRCNVTQSEYITLSNKYPQYKPSQGVEGWHYHCDKE
ncbi:MAG: membrane lipoprotein lipid attachment site-containing protein [Flavipsychrobacter sp.]|nr:membrane lipoprotein lipid attachment site-containing protein [Flavipsychrobacter sp.]